MNVLPQLVTCQETRKCALLFIFTTYVQDVTPEIKFIMLKLRSVFRVNGEIYQSDCLVCMHLEEMTRFFSQYQILSVIY